MESADQFPLLTNIRKKMRDEGVKVAAIVSKCERIDRNKDMYIHIDDLEEIIQDSLKTSKLTKREMNFLLGQLTHDRRRGNIEYNHLFDVLEGRNLRKDSERERWYNPEQVADSPKPGTIGEYLERAACPAEIQNFKRFIAALETYERGSGNSVGTSENGFLIPLGPDLKVSVQFILPR